MARTSKTYTFVIAANQAYPLNVAGKYFKILKATGNVRVDSFDGISLDGMSGGNGQEETPFSRLHFTDQSGAPNTIKVVVADEKFIDSSLGNVIISGAVTVSSGSIAVTSNAAPEAAMTHSAPAVTLASTQALAAKANRQYLMLQNQHGSGNVWVSIDGSAASADALCFKIGPGGFFEPGVIPTGAIFIIGDVAHNLLAVIEG